MWYSHEVSGDDSTGQGSDLLEAGPFSAELRQSIERRLRKHWRERMRKVRQAMPQSLSAERSARIVEQLKQMPSFEKARGVGLFWPMLERREVDLRALDSFARAQGKRVYYPFLRDNQTGFAELKEVAELAESSWGFAEPPAHSPAALAGELDWIAVPALMLAPTGHRLGYGRGYYDVTLPDYCPPAISVGVGYDFQLGAELPALPHDIATHWVVTETKCFEAGKYESSAPPRRALGRASAGGAKPGPQAGE